jgi:toxin ParE1/3/4
MARIELLPEVFDDFERFLDHLDLHEVPDASERIHEILQANDILATSPLIGCPVKAGKRELVIGAGARGYVALYRHVPAIDTVFVLTIRHQKEPGFKPR